MSVAHRDAKHLFFVHPYALNEDDCPLPCLFSEKGFDYEKNNDY